MFPSFSSSSSSEDESFLRAIRGTSRAITFEYTLESLVAAREQEPPIPRCTPEVPPAQPPEFVPPSEITALLCRDGFVFDLATNTFSRLVIDFLPDPPLPSLPQSPPLSDWQLKALQLCPEQFPPSPPLLYSLMLKILDPSFTRLLGSSLVRSAKVFNSVSIDFSIWLSIIQNAINVNIESLVYLLALFIPEQFIVPKGSNPAITVILLHFASLLCPTIAEHPEYCLSFVGLRSSLESAEFLNEGMISDLSSRCCNLGLSVPAPNLSFWISSFPLSGFGAQLFFPTGSRLVLGLMEMNIPEVLTIEKFLQALENLRKQCKSREDVLVARVSAVRAIGEKVLVSADKLGLANTTVLKQAVRHLNFAFPGSDISVMTELKEQLHVTRVQIEILDASELSKK
jgi:hypothetical protein